MHNITKNFSYLFVGQLLNQIIPLLMVPYLIKKIGMDLYGVYSYIILIGAFLFIVADGIFSLAGVPKVARNREKLSVLNWIYGNSVSSKIIILFFFIFFYLVYVFFNESYKDFAFELFLGVFIFSGMIFQNNWFLQGLGLFKDIVIFSLIGKIFFVCLVLLFLRGREDFWVLVLINGISQWTIVIISSVRFRKIGLNINHVNILIGLKFLRKNIKFLISRLLGSCYGTLPGLILGAFSGNSSYVAIYSAAEQLYKGLVSLTLALHQVIYPHIVRSRSFLFVKKVIFGFFLWGGVCYILSLFLSKYVVVFIYGADFFQSSVILNYFAIIYMISNISSVLGYPLMSLRGDLDCVNNSILYAAILQIGVLIFVFFQFGFTPLSMVVCVLVTEVFVLLFRLKFGVLDYWRVK